MKIPPIVTLAGMFLSVMSTQAAVVIYEPFSQTVGGLNGTAGGTGLSGNWTTSGASPVSVVGGTATYGTLPTSGNQVFAGYNPEGSQVNSNASISMGSTLSDAGLLTDGAELWFSVLYTVPDTTSTNSNFGFAIGSAGLTVTSSLASGQNAIGFSIGRNTRLTASYWNNSQSNGATVLDSIFTVGSTNLIVGQIIWGASSETINLYLPGTDLVMGSQYDTVTTTGNLDQSTFSTLSFGGKNVTTTPQGVDEIRFGSSYNDVIGVPEPCSLMLLGLSGLGFLFRRRRRL